MLIGTIIMSHRMRFVKLSFFLNFVFHVLEKMINVYSLKKK